jgi:hypothetical protein
MEVAAPADNIRMKPLLLALLVAVAPAAAHADSDGYYCIGPGYFAFQLGMDMPANPVRLSVVRTGDMEPISITLAPFQVHGMVCGERAVQLLGWDNAYHVELDASQGPVRYTTTPLAKPGTRPPEFEPDQSGNLGAVSRPARMLKPQKVAIGTDSRRYTYWLEIVPRPIKQCEVEITSRLIERDPRGREKRVLRIFHDRAPRECGE